MATQVPMGSSAQWGMSYLRQPTDGATWEKRGSDSQPLRLFLPLLRGHTRRQNYQPWATCFSFLGFFGIGFVFVLKMNFVDWHGGRYSRAIAIGKCPR